MVRLHMFFFERKKVSLLQRRKYGHLSKKNITVYHSTKILFFLLKMHAYCEWNIIWYTVLLFCTCILYRQIWHYSFQNTHKCWMKYYFLLNLSVKKSDYEKQNCTKTDHFFFLIFHDIFLLRWSVRWNELCSTKK